MPKQPDHLGQLAEVAELINQGRFEAADVMLKKLKATTDLSDRFVTVMVLEDRIKGRVQHGYVPGES